jgi:hypothetical protein
MSIQKLYILPKRKIAQIAIFRVIFGIFIFTLEKNKYTTLNKKRTGKNHSQF